jgi:signal transduction histidine kinase
MQSLRRLLTGLRSDEEPGEARRLELAIARARLFLVASSLLFALLGLPERFPPVAIGLLAGYLLAGGLLLAWLRLRDPSPALRWTCQAGDLLAAVLLSLSTPAAAYPFFVFFAFVLLTAAFRWGLREAVLSAGASALLLFAGEVLLGSAAETLEVWPLRAAWLLVLGLLLGYLASQEKALRAESSQAKAMDRALVARELHDGAIQSLIGMEVQVDVLRRQAEEQQLAMAGELARIQEMLRGEVLNLRELMQQMKPQDLSPRQLLDFLAEYVDRFWRETGISASFVSDLDEVSLPPAVCREVARIVQEALVNVRKHSGAQNVIVRLGREPKAWKLEVDDDGRGFDFEGRLSQEDLDDSRKGPVIIKERVRAIGGQLTVESSRGRGARLEISLPRTRG